jgi:osmotically inducible protein OsmC
VRQYTAVAISTGRNGRAYTADGQLDLQLAMQKELGGDGNGVNPEQLFAAGYAACFATSMQMVAEKKGLDVSGLSITAEVGLSPNGKGGFQLDVSLRAKLPDSLPEEARRDLIDTTHQVCPYSNATRGNIPVELAVV